jgi:hypothetical protein
MNKSHQEIISAYLNWYRTRKEEYWWAYETVDRMRSPSDLTFVFELLQACHNDMEIAYVAAGPLEDIFYPHHLVIKNELSIMVRQHAFMRKAIQAIFASPGSPARKSLDEILNKYGLHYASL